MKTHQAVYTMVRYVIKYQQHTSATNSTIGNQAMITQQSVIRETVTSVIS